MLPALISDELIRLYEEGYGVLVERTDMIRDKVMRIFLNKSGVRNVQKIYTRQTTTKAWM